jgi:hypothetical protein
MLSSRDQPADASDMSAVEGIQLWVVKKVDTDTTQEHGMSDSEFSHSKIDDIAYTSQIPDTSATACYDTADHHFASFHSFVPG